MTEGTRLFDPPTARDCVEAGKDVGYAQGALLVMEDVAGHLVNTDGLIEARARLSRVGDLLAAIAGDRAVGVDE